jgi:hypothetical protein
LPKDPAAPQYIALLDVLQEKKPQSKAGPRMALPDATKTIVKSIIEAAHINNMGIRVYDGDDLTEFYVNRAAKAAAKLPPEVAADAFLLGLGIGLNDANWVRSTPSFGAFCRQIESNDEFSTRVNLIGKPTLGKRHDLALHYMLSAALTVHFGSAAAEKAGLLKEVDDAEGKSGFSFIDLTADLSGIAFAEAVRNKKIKFAQLSDVFPTDNYLPKFDDLQENIPYKDFEKNFGSLDDPRFQKELQKLKNRVKELSGLKPLPPESKR